MVHSLFIVEIAIGHYNFTHCFSTILQGSTTMKLNFIISLNYIWNVISPKSLGTKPYITSLVPEETLKDPFILVESAKKWPNPKSSKSQ